MKPGDVIPSNSVIIPADVAKEIATHFRKVNAGPNSRNEKWADLLDPQPQPQSLREQVLDALWATLYSSDTRSGAWPGGDRAADAVLAVVADWLAAQPLDSRVTDKSWSWPRVQRDHDVRLLRGQS